jgi:hypothetical protein
MKRPVSSPVTIELNAVLVALTANEPQVLTLEDGTLLPSGPFESEHPTLQTGVRAWVEQQTHHPLGYVEQLYTFADRSRADAATGRRVVSISYLGLVREELPRGGGRDPEWRNWYRYLPWEDWRHGPPALVARLLLPALRKWADTRERKARIEINFGDGRKHWNEELVLQRYEMLYEAGLIAESGAALDPALGMPMRYDHRRILATGIARLRAKIKYRPVVFELMPEAFTLLRLQRAVEALAGRLLHKQNFRRLIDQQGLVEETGAVSAESAGRPAKLYRFRREIVAERAAGGSKLPLSRPA